MAALIYPRGPNNVNLSIHFSLSEFLCGCGKCPQTKVDPDLITKLEALRALCKATIRINSGYRCREYQDDLRRRGYDTATGVSQHELGRAADVSTESPRLSGAEIEVLARRAGFKAVGVGMTWAHLDLRDDKERRWVYGV